MAQPIRRTFWGMAAGGLLAWAGMLLPGCGWSGSGNPQFQAGSPRERTHSADRAAPADLVADSPPLQTLPQASKAAVNAFLPVPEALPVPAGESTLADTPPSEEVVQVLAAVRRRQGSVLAGSSLAGDAEQSDEAAEFRQALGAAAEPAEESRAEAAPVTRQDAPQVVTPPGGDFQELPRVAAPGKLRAFGRVIDEDEPGPAADSAPLAPEPQRSPGPIADPIADPLLAAAVALEHLAADAEAAGQAARADRLRTLSAEVRREARRVARTGSHEKTGKPAAFSRSAN